MRFGLHSGPVTGKPRRLALGCYRSICAALTIFFFSLNDQVVCCEASALVFSFLVM